MLSFLCTLCKKHKSTLITISGAAGSSIGFLWGFDIQKLTPSGTLSPELMWQVRMFLTPILISLYFLSLLITLLYHYKKDVDNYEAKLNPPPLFFKFNPESLSSSTDAKKETTESASHTEKSPIRSFPVSKIPDSKPKPTEPAAASSAPGPDDYHATRRSFFNIDRPKRR